ncbi:MAG: YdcH family protein [Litorimonas sp.]
MTDSSDSSDTPNVDPELTAEEEEAQAIELLERLKLEHRRIDQEINALAETGVADMLKVKRMKKIKLSIKDQIAYLENQITPDIIA